MLASFSESSVIWDFQVKVESFNKNAQTFHILTMISWLGTINFPEGIFDIPTDRDQQKWVFANDPKIILPLTENPQKYFMESKILKELLIQLARIE